MNKELILQKLNSHLKEVEKRGIDADRIVGIFLYGSQNYGFANENSDVDSKVIIIPTFNDFCLRTKDLVSKEIILENGEHIVLKDIRLYRENLLKQNINFTEILFTEYAIVNPRYEKIFNDFFYKYRENIVRINEEKAFFSISGQILNTLKQGRLDNKKLYNSKRLLIFLENYLKGKSYEECLQPKGDIFNFLWGLKYGLSDFSKNKEFKQELAEDIENRIFQLRKDFNELKKEPHLIKEDPIGLYAINQGTIELIKESFQDKKKDELISKKDFFQKLTHAEERAFYSIIEEIHSEGNISISKLIEKNKISRPVYNNLILKMKNLNVAEITNMGMKGTYIKITHPQLKMDAIDF